MNRAGADGTQTTNQTHLARFVLCLSLCVSLSCAQGETQDEPACAVTSVPEDLAADPFYKKYCEADGGMPILASDAVSDEALTTAAALVARVLSARPTLRDGIVAAGGRVALLGQDEQLIDLPEADANMIDEQLNVSRGIAFVSNDPPIAVAPEENVLCWPTDDRSSARESTLLHELAHVIHLVGLKEVQREGTVVTFAEELRQAYLSAMANGLWTDTYASKNDMEYWAEGVGLYFTAPTGPKYTGEQVGVEDREALREYDPALFELLHWAFGDDDWYPACPKRRKAPLAGRSCVAPYSGDGVISSSVFGLTGTSVSGTVQLPRAVDRLTSASIWVRGLSDDSKTVSSFVGALLPAGTSQFRYTIANVPPGEYSVRMMVSESDLSESKPLWAGTYEAEGNPADVARVGSTPRCGVDATLDTPEKFEWASSSKARPSEQGSNADGATADPRR